METQDMKKLDMTWDLESIFPGGSESKEFTQYRSDIKADLETVKAEIETLPRQLNDGNRGDWATFIVKLQKLLSRIHHASAFTSCLVSQNVSDVKAHQISGEIDVFISKLKNLMVSVEAFAKAQTDDEWEKLLADDRLVEVQFSLNETRQIAQMKMNPEYEALATELAVNGYHAWNRLYDKVYGDLRVKFDEYGKTRELSIGQLAIKMADADRNIRRQAQEKLEEAWERVSEWMAMVLNYQAGFRLTLYDRRNWKTALVEPMINARMKEESLRAMWRAVERGVPKLRGYIDAKKKLLGIDRFKWYDQFAPVGQVDRKISFSEAGDFIIDLMKDMDTHQATFARMALDNRWVEAEDRPGKAGGGFCTTLTEAGQSRIFMTYGNTFAEVATLAHELGHAYHHEVLKDKPPFAQDYPMNLAETASIFNELLIFDGALGKAGSNDEKLMMLDQKLQNTFTLFCNLHARFIFDSDFYVERKKGLVTKARLDEMMTEAQKKAFGDLLEGDDAYHPLFWASKLHFFLTGQPFYNFPYTFGFLFATGIYNRARQEGPKFADKYREILVDTGRMTCEEVAKKHLGVDLTKDDFWNEAVNASLADVEEFVKIAK